MLDLKLWSKLYWENENNHWKNMAQELENNSPYDYARELATRIQKINDNYFQECAEGSPGYYPTVELDKKYKKLKKQLGDQSQQISIKDWANEIKKVGEKSILFFYYFAKQTEMKEKVQISSLLKNYNSTIISFLKNSFINGDTTIHNLDNELQDIMAQNNSKSNDFLIEFYKEESKKEWFKNNLEEIVDFRSFVFYNAWLIDESKEDLKQWGQYLKENINDKKLSQLNSTLVSYLELFEKEERLIELSQELPIEYYEAFKKLVFSDINTMPIMEKWYDIVLGSKREEKKFFNKIWLPNEKGVRVTTNLSAESIILDFICNKMSVIYTKEELENFDFRQSIISNDNIQDTMNKKLNYYYLENKLTANNKKVKQIKI